MEVNATIWMQIIHTITSLIFSAGFIYALVMVILLFKRVKKLEQIIEKHFDNPKV